MLEKKNKIKGCLKHKWVIDGRSNEYERGEEELSLRKRNERRYHPVITTFYHISEEVRVQNSFFLFRNIEEGYLIFWKISGRAEKKIWPLIKPLVCLLSWYIKTIYIFPHSLSRILNFHSSVRSKSKYN